MNWRNNLLIKMLIDFSSTQIISKPCDIQTTKRSDNDQVNNNFNYDILLI